MYFLKFKTVFDKNKNMLNQSPIVDFLQRFQMQIILRLEDEEKAGKVKQVRINLVICSAKELKMY